MTSKNKDIIITGFALFAMFFGAGNLIFPPYLGVVSGEKFLIGFAGFILSDVGLSLLAIFAASKCNGDTQNVFAKAGNKFALLLSSAIMICLGPLLAIPRTGATTFEMGISPIIPGFNSLIFSVVFFTVTLVLTIKPSKVIDIIGAYLTPALLVCLIALILVGILEPIGNFTPSKIEGVFNEGISQGYQTLDALGAICLSAVIIRSLSQKGYKSEKTKMEIMIKAGLISAVGLIIVYGGLTYLGATVSSIYDENVSQSFLIVAITSALLKTPGKVILSIIVTLACLTTSIGLTSAVAQYFAKITNNKLTYEKLVVAICVFSVVISNLGVDAIIKFSAPILNIIYPTTVVLIFATIFNKQIKNSNSVKFAAYTALIMGVFTAVDDLGFKIAILKSLPFYSLGFCWILPAIIAGAIGHFVKAEESDLEEEYEIEDDIAV